MNDDVITPAFYLPPISAISEFTKAANANLYFEKWEHFPKQTYRNRASIHSPNGKLDLIIPVVKGKRQHTIMKDVRINYDDNWQRVHWMSLQTCYRRSAYFEYYEDDFAPFYERKIPFLFDYNIELIHLILNKLKVNKKLLFTASYEADFKGADVRGIIHPKKIDAYQPKPYFQVFEPKNGFIANLSIVDLLFNMGSSSMGYL